MPRKSSFLIWKDCHALRCIRARNDDKTCVIASLPAGEAGRKGPYLFDDSPAIALAKTGAIFPS